MHDHGIIDVLNSTLISFTVDRVAFSYSNNISESWTSETSSSSTYEKKITIENLAVSLLLTSFALTTIVGNVLVIIAVCRERYLRTVTNYFIVSLAISDLLIGAVVMPFAVSLHVTDGHWLFGSDWCDVWHSLDVLASTASILNLSVISLDRYCAITDPFSYPCKMSIRRSFALIAIIWICSAAISFPAIVWWRSVYIQTDQPTSSFTRLDTQCTFTEDTGYLIFSSIISFYVPVTVILYAYYKIYKAATRQMRSLKIGSKVMLKDDEGGEAMTLRIHCANYQSKSENSDELDGGERDICLQEDTIGANRRVSPVARQQSTTAMSRRLQQESIESCILKTGRQASPYHPATSPITENSHRHLYRRRVGNRKWTTTFTLSKKLGKLAKEQKAAKTLGIVMGVFCFCWVPFFITNVLFGICKQRCVPHAELIFPVFAWLGYLNSGMNPVIYACSMRDFRRAFAKILLCCFSTRYRHAMHRRDYYYDTSVSSSSLTTTAPQWSERHVK